MKEMRPRWDWEGPEEFCEFFLESKNPEFEHAFGPWRDEGGMEDVKVVIQRVVREKHDGVRDFDMEVFLFVARK